MVQWAVDAAAAATDGVVLVLPAGEHDAASGAGAIAGADVVVAGAATRSGSVRAGLAAVADRLGDDDVVVIHDGARPLASAGLFATVVDAVRSGADGAIPAVGVTDTIKVIDGGVVVDTPDRSRLAAVQTPQAFRFGVVRQAHATEPEATDDAALVEAAGAKVVVVDGEALNLKVTTAADLAAVEQAVSGPVPMRVGHGFDVHRFSDDPGRALVLGGVTIDGAPGLEGHSDADVVAHACADALLGAAGLGDIGQHFPDTDPAHAGADSMALLASVVASVAEAGWRPVNVDCSVVCETPRLAPHRDQMQQRLSAVVGAPVSVKANRAERLGALGRSEGIACMAVAMVAQ